MIESVHSELVEADDTLARIVLRPQLTNPADAAKTWRFEGVLRGPFCEGAHTLPGDFAIRQTGSSVELIATIVDPCYWTPELPMLYEVVIRAIAAGAVVDEHRSSIGFRR